MVGGGRDNLKKRGALLRERGREGVREWRGTKGMLEGAIAVVALAKPILLHDSFSIVPTSSWLHCLVGLVSWGHAGHGL